MGLMSFISKQFIDVIQWTEDQPGILAYRYPMQDKEIQNGAQLVVRETQRAAFFNEGKWADQFGAGTRTVALAIAAAPGFSLAGGGDTIAAIQKYDIYDRVSYISTAGGAFLEYLEGKVLPAVDILEKRARN